MKRKLSRLDVTWLPVVMAFDFAVPAQRLAPLELERAPLPRGGFVAGGSNSP